jgi:predicted patatin/cPLA2 family phospholipase
MRGAVSAGMVIALHELGLTECFDGVFGASAGALNAVWLLSGNPSDGLRPYADPALIRQYIRKANALRGRPVVDTRHLVERLYEDVLPLRFDAVLAHSVRLHPLATDVETGRAVDLEPTVRDKASLKLALRASTALPLLAGPPVVIGGRRYLDAGLAESIPFHAALAAGATHVLVLRSRRLQDAEQPSGLSRALTSLLLRRLGEPVRRGYLDRAKRLAEDDALLDRHAADGALEPSMFALRPPADSPRVSRLESDPGVVRAGLEAGRDAALAALGIRPATSGQASFDMTSTQEEAR